MAVPNQPIPASPIAKVAPVDYSYSGPFDHTIVNSEFAKVFDDGSFADSTSDDLDSFLSRIESDDGITDIRWAAYMLATVYHENLTNTKAVKRIIYDNKGKPLVDKAGNVKTKTLQKKWLYQPFTEKGLGKGLGYYEPVKVALQDSGNYLVTEQDGDQFTVSPLGVPPGLASKKAGAPYQGAHSLIYDKAAGTEHSYYGRGYVQLTW